MPSKKVTCEDLQIQIDKLSKQMTLGNIVGKEFKEKSVRKEECMGRLVTLTDNIEKLREKDNIFQNKDKKLDELKRRTKELEDELSVVKKEDVKDFMELKRGVEKQYKELKKAKDVSEDINNTEKEMKELGDEIKNLSDSLKKLQKVIDLFEIELVPDDTISIEEE